MDNNEAMEYQQGFNEGYLIAQHLPDLSNELTRIKSISPRILGIQNGQEQHLLEQIQNNRNQLNDRSRQRDLDDLEK